MKCNLYSVVFQNLRLKRRSLRQNHFPLWYSFFKKFYMSICTNIFVFFQLKLLSESMKERFLVFDFLELWLKLFDRSICIDAERYPSYAAKLNKIVAGVYIKKESICVKKKTIMYVCINIYSCVNTYTHTRESKRMRDLIFSPQAWTIFIIKNY